MVLTRITNHQSLSECLELFAIDLPILLDAAGHAHRARLEDQAAISVIGIWEKHHLVHAALVLERHEHHVAVIFCSHMTVGHHPAAQRHALSAQVPQLVAPSLAVARQKIEWVAAHAHFEDFAFVAQLLFQRVFRRLHFGQCHAGRILPVRLCNNVSAFSGSAIPCPGRSAPSALRMNLRSCGALGCVPLPAACSRFHCHNISGRVIARASAHISSNAPHLMSVSISSRSTGTRRRKSSSDWNAPPSSRARSIAVIVSTPRPFTCINPTRSACFPSSPASAVYSIRE